VERRIIRTSRCDICNTLFAIELFSKNTCRPDLKRPFYPSENDSHYCAFRCRGCGEVVDIVVQGAEYETDYWKDFIRT